MSVRVRNRGWRVGITSAVVAALAVVACGNHYKPPPPLDGTGDTTPAIGGGGGAGGGAHDASTDVDAGCIPITNSAAVVSEAYVGEQLPQALGGAITAGNYALTGAFVYTGVGGTTGATGNLYQETASFDGVAFADVAAAGNADAGAVGNGVLTSGTYTTNGTLLSLAATCPTAATSSVAYTAAGNTIRLYSAQSERVYTLQ